MQYRTSVTDMGKHQKRICELKDRSLEIIWLDWKKKEKEKSVKGSISS